MHDLQLQDPDQRTLYGQSMKTIKNLCLEPLEAKETENIS